MTAAKAQSYGLFMEFVSGSYTNVTDYVVEASIRRSAAGLFRDFQAGELTTTLDNSDARFSPAKTSSPLYPNVKINRRCYFQASYGGSAYTLFTGRINEISIAPTLESGRRVTFVARDELMPILEKTITTTVFDTVNAGSVVAAVFVDASVNSYSVDVLTDILPYASFDKITAGTALQRLIETGAYNFYVDQNGISRFRTRHWDQEGFSAVQASYSSLFDLTYTLDEGQIINAARIRGIPRDVVVVNSPVAYTIGSIPIAASGGIGFFLDYIDPENSEPSPAVNLITPVAGSDYLINASEDGTGANLTGTSSLSIAFFGQSVVASVWNGTGTAGYLTRFQVRGDIFRRFPAIGGDKVDDSSQAIYGDKSFELTSEFLGEQAQQDAYAQYLVARNKEPKGRITPILKNEFPDVIQRNLGEVIHITESNLGVSAKFVVIGLEHNIISQDAGWEHELALEVEETRDELLFFLDVDELDGDKRLSF